MYDIIFKVPWREKKAAEWSEYDEKDAKAINCCLKDESKLCGTTQPPFFVLREGQKSEWTTVGGRGTWQPHEGWGVGWEDLSGCGDHLDS